MKAGQCPVPSLVRSVEADRLGECTGFDQFLNMVFSEGHTRELASDEGLHGPADLLLASWVLARGFRELHGLPGIGAAGIESEQGYNGE